MNRVEITRAQYNALTIKNANTAYLITDENGTVYKGSNLINKSWNGYVPSVSSIAVTTPPTKTSYMAGEALDLTGLVVTKYMDDSTSEVISDYTTVPANGTVLTTADTSVTISYQGKTCTQAITIITLSSIAVTTPPTKVSYETGDALDLTGMVVTATYSDSSTAPISNYTTSPANGTILSTVGTTTVTINYESKTCTQDVNVVTAPQELCITANTAGSTVELTVSTSGASLIANTAYSRNGRDWVSFTPAPATTPGVNIITLENIGDKVYFRNDITGSISNNSILMFEMSGSLSASGNVNSLYSATNFENLTTLTYTYCFAWLFSQCSALTTPPQLPATSLSAGCYRSMFHGCSSLTTAPALPATVLADSCYLLMFSECRILATAPVLPATTLANNCYASMFTGCWALVVSDSSTETGTQVWNIPSTGSYTNTYIQYSMFQYCAGTRASNNMAGEAGQSYTYYTQNAPV